MEVQAAGLRFASLLAQPGLRLFPASGPCWAAGSLGICNCQEGREGFLSQLPFHREGGTWASCAPREEINPLLSPKLGSQWLQLFKKCLVSISYVPGPCQHGRMVTVVEFLLCTSISCASSTCQALLLLVLQLASFDLSSGNLRKC